MNKDQMAIAIGELAEDIGFHKDGLPQPLRLAAISLLREMHKFAQELAGEDAVSATLASAPTPPGEGDAMYIHERIMLATLPLISMYYLEPVELVGEMCQAAWVLSNLGPRGLARLQDELEEKARVR